MTARRIVTLPPLPPDACAAFAAEAGQRGAQLLEVRTDLHPRSLELGPLGSLIDLLVAERGAPLPEAWRRAAALVDRPLEAGDLQGATLVSLHAPEPLEPQAALALWLGVPPHPDVEVKHIEPLGLPSQASRLFETQRLLSSRFGASRVTVLATGPLALPFRALLAERNALDYLAADATWAAAPGQRLLDDAVRAARAPGAGARLGILGSRIAHSRSPRIHPQPFDRLDLPEDAPIAELLEALHPFYRGFAVTSPFKKRAAQASDAANRLEAVNTLARTARGWRGANTDVEGARAALEVLGASEVIALGDGGVTSALRLACLESGRTLRVVRAQEVASGPVRGACVWTWPEHVGAPAPLRFDRARVAIVAYGLSAHRLAAEVTRRGGDPVLVGARWFIAQAREQRRVWEEER